jgi:hypothetical protein
MITFYLPLPPVSVMGVVNIFNVNLAPLPTQLIFDISDINNHEDNTLFFIPTLVSVMGVSNIFSVIE